MVRNAAFRRVELAARGDIDGLAGAESAGGWDRARWTEALAAYAAEHGRTGPDHSAIGTGTDARSGAWFQPTEAPVRWTVRQVIDDPDGNHDWAIVGEIDLAASDEEGAPVWRTVRFDRP